MQNLILRLIIAYQDTKEVLDEEMKQIRKIGRRLEKEGDGESPLSPGPLPSHFFVKLKGEASQADDSKPKLKERKERLRPGSLILATRETNFVGNLIALLALTAKVL